MTEREYESFKEFIHKILYEVMDLDDYECVLEELDIPIKSKRHTKYWLLASGCHNVDTRLAKANLQFWLDKKSFKCYSECGCSYNLLTLVEKRFKTLSEQKNRVQCMKWICNIIGQPFEFSDDEEKPKRDDIFNWKSQLSMYIKTSYKELEYKSYDKAVLNYFPKVYHQSWLDYGISEETMERYGIRWYPYKQQIVIPCINKDGELIGIRIRNMNPDIPVKYMPLQLLDGTEYNFPTSGFMYGENFNSDEIRRTKSAWLVEAEKSVLKADTWFGESSVALGLYGHDLQKDKLDYLISLGVDTVYLMIDSDFYYTTDEVFVVTNGKVFLMDEYEVTEGIVKAWDFETEEEAECYTNDEFYVEKVRNVKYDIFEERVMKMYDKLKPYVRNVYVVYNNQGYWGYKYSPFDFTREQFDVLFENKEEIQ